MSRPKFPQSFREFQDSEEACRTFLIRSRWPEGFECPRCGSGDVGEVKTRSLFQCKECRCQVSATSGTVMHQRQLDLSRYETAWVMLQKLRRAMVRPERDRIDGSCEIDETYVGGHEEGRKGGRQKSEVKSIVVGAAEIRGKSTGRIRLAVVSDFSAESLAGFVERAVEPGNTVLTDGWQGYFPLPDMGYDHRAKSQGPRKNASQHLPRIHRVFGNLKTWIDGTHHGVSQKHLPHYLDEFVFRFNRRKTPMAAFQTLLGMSGQYQPTTYKMLYVDESTG